MFNILKMGVLGFFASLMAMFSSLANAIDTAAAVTAIQGAGTDADTVAGAVIVLVAGLIVVGIVISLMRKA